MSDVPHQAPKRESFTIAPYPRECLCATLRTAGNQICRYPEKTSLLEIYKAVEKEKPLLHLDTHTNPECGVGVNIQLALADYYRQIQNDVENSMRNITLQDIINSYLERISK